MRAGLIGFIATPRQGNALPPGTAWCADNGVFGAGWPGEGKWWRWVQRHVAASGSTCAFVVAPDVVTTMPDGSPLGDAAATLARSAPWLPRIRALGVPAAFVIQDGAAGTGMVPWGEFDALFIGGSTPFKLGADARTLAAEAKRRGLTVHMGRVNSGRRWRYAEAIGCDSVDGTTLAVHPSTLTDVLGWRMNVPLL